MVAAVGGSGESAMTDAEWEAAWREFWSDAVDETEDQGQPA
jgi:hypothetical protein